MKASTKKVLEAATKVAHAFGFEDPEWAFWQCNLFSNAVVKVNRAFGNHDLDLILVRAEWQIDSGDVEAGAVHKHVLIKHGEKYIDFTIRQIDDEAKFPYVSKRLPRYYEDLGEIDIEDHLDGDKEYIDAIVEAIDPKITVKSNPQRKNKGKCKCWHCSTKPNPITDKGSEFKRVRAGRYQLIVDGNETSHFLTRIEDGGGELEGWWTHNEALIDPCRTLTDAKRRLLEALMIRPNPHTQTNKKRMISELSAEEILRVATLMKAGFDKYHIQRTMNVHSSVIEQVKREYSIR